MVGRAAAVAAGGTRGLVVAGAVDPCDRAAPATVGIPEVPRARGCEAGVVTKAARLTEAGTAEQRRRQKSQEGPGTEAAVQRKR